MDKWIKNNTASKLIALAVSILLWAMVHMDSGTPAPPTTFYDTKIIEGVKIQTYGFDDGEYVLTGIDQDRVNLEVRGKKSNISLLTDEYKVKLDLSNVKEPGTHTLPLTYSIPSGVEMVSMEPSVVTVTVEPRVSKSVTVSIGTKGEPAKDYRAGTPVLIDPRQVTVTLPESSMANLGQVKGNVELDGAKEKITEKRVKLTAYDKEGAEMEDAVIEPATVAVEVPIEPAFVTLPLELQYTGRLPEGFVLSKVEQKVKEVKLFGSNEALAGAETYIEAAINLGEVRNSGTTVLTADLTPPEGFEKIEPSSVTVEVTAVSHGERVITGIPITLNGVPSGLDAIITDPKTKTISLTLTGAPDLLNSLEPTDIGAEANVTGLKAGVHEVPLQITLPNFINRTDQDRPVIKIELKDNSKPVTTNPGTSNNEGTDKDKPDVPGTGTGTGTGHDQGEDPETPPANEGTDNSGSGENPSHPPGDGSSDGTTGTETSNDG
ncbi:YbbR domain-containing protein [Paenibacillus sp. cl141a]|uniref:CdaR family protein n=1 Tax=Paenibacillus sp. cl141a TaxID=1761877 RepID=UPI0008D22222|nr:CdaR family protein [Paenibacillus sp. cl141a]SEM49194.1 YbbR domain-containing protein [Paenibacillus sp. cl141a]